MWLKMFRVRIGELIPSPSRGDRRCTVHPPKGHPTKSDPLAETLPSPSIADLRPLSVHFCSCYVCLVLLFISLLFLMQPLLYNLSILLIKMKLIITVNLKCLPKMGKKLLIYFFLFFLDFKCFFVLFKI